MKILILLTTNFILLTTNHAFAYDTVRCKSKNAELVFHTMVYSTLAVGDYTIHKGVKRNLLQEAQSTNNKDLLFFSQNRIFKVEGFHTQYQMKFTLLAKLFGDEPTVLEKGICKRL